MNKNNTLKERKHKKYLLRFLDILPTALQTMDTTRVTIAYFAISGLDVLDALDEIPEDRKRGIIQWLYSLQVIDNVDFVSGFQNSATFCTIENRGFNSPYKWSHIAGTYCALCCLLILGDDLGCVDRKAISASLRTLQLSNGCYTASKDGSESDMRFLYCAASICYILNDWSAMDVEKATEFILNSISYDFGIAQGPELESHGGSSYCAIATLVLTNQLHRLSDRQLKGLTRWLLNRQEDGFQGRPHKPVDTCYSFWVGAALKMLDAYKYINESKNREYVLMTQDGVIGGFSKWVDSTSDPLHTYMGLAGLSLMHGNNLMEVQPALNVTVRTHEHLMSLHEKWNKS